MTKLTFGCYDKEGEWLGYVIAKSFSDCDTKAIAEWGNDNGDNIIQPGYDKDRTTLSM
jgi:hypothetical protein